jgi:hypothetical protein
MSSADKFELFMKICGTITAVLFVLNILNVIDISWWIVFAPVILVIILIMKELGV